RRARARGGARTHAGRLRDQRGEPRARAARSSPPAPRPAARSTHSPTRAYEPVATRARSCRLRPSALRNSARLLVYSGPMPRILVCDEAAAAERLRDQLLSGQSGIRVQCETTPRLAKQQLARGGFDVYVLGFSRHPGWTELLACAAQA